MSEKVSLWAAVKDNWGQITGIGAVLLVGHLFIMSVMIDRAVTAELSNQDIGTDAKIISMDDDIDDAKSLANAAQASATANATRIDGNERRVEQAFQAFWDIIKAKPTE